MPPLENDQKQHDSDDSTSSSEAETDSPSLIPFYWEGEKEATPISWLVRDLFPDRSVSLIIGESQAGKSFVAIDLAVAVASGRTFFGKDTVQGGVLIIAAEGAFTIPGRMKSARREIPASEKLPIVVIDQPPDLTTPEGITQILRVAKHVDEKMQLTFSIPLSLVIIDTLMSAFTVKNWNDTGETMSAINMLRSIGLLTRTAVVGIHHHGKDVTRGAAGSFALTAGPDSILSVYRKATDDGSVTARHIALTKSRPSGTGWTCDFKLDTLPPDLCNEGDDQAFVVPLLETAGFRESKTTKPKASAAGKGADGFHRAFEDAVGSHGQEQRLPDGGIVRAVLTASVRDSFTKFYQAKKSADPVGATRAAFNRELSKTTVGPIRRGEWDGHQWLYAVVDPN
jgi:AAA domain